MVTYQHVEALPRIPLDCSIDITYRCNNTCVHCWLREDDSSEVAAGELTLDEICGVVDQARSLGTQRWSISGGEPLLRSDFAEVFDYVTYKTVGYSLNTNGTLVTPAIARLLRRKGNKMVAVYGATADVYERVTGNPLGFEQLLQGLAYLKEARAGFTVQLIPMRENWHQWEMMCAFARRWSDHYRVGAPWLHKTACGDLARNAEIERQRLDPEDVVALDPPVACMEEGHPEEPRCSRGSLYAECIEGGRVCHIDPYGGVSFCSFVKDPALRFDLKKKSLAEAWEVLIPSLVGMVPAEEEYLEGCGSCSLSRACRWCSVFAYLEHGRHGAKIEYLCAVARAAVGQR